jgi:hypothetical protein
MTHRARPFCFIVNERRFRPTTSTHIQLRVIFEHCDQQAGESQVKYNTGLTGWGAPKQPGTPEGSLQKRWRLLLKVKNYASNKAKKRAALMARSKKRAASSKSDKSNTSFQLWERTPRQDKDWVGFSRVGNETTFMEWVEAKPPALFESQGQARPSALKRAVCITG